MQNKKIELNVLKAGGGKSRPGSSNKRELHGYDGPLQYLSQGNPDSMTTVQVLPSVQASSERLVEDSCDGDNTRPVAPPRQKSSSLERSRPSTAHSTSKQNLPKSLSMGLTSDEEDEESTPIISSITSPMEEGTPTAPLNISNSPSTNILGGKDKNSNGVTEGEDGSEEESEHIVTEMMENLDSFVLEP